jgi:thymidylate kinase
MDSESHQTNPERQAWMAFNQCASALESNRLAVELRPRPRDEDTAFSGDYDFLIHPDRFGEIVQLFFRICTEHNVSFQVWRRATFKNRIIFLTLGGREIVLEFWPHAELTKVNHRKGESFLTYRGFSDASEAGYREETLALLFICHLFFKRKDLSDSQNQWRLGEFAGRMDAIAGEGMGRTSLAGDVRQLLEGIIRKDLTLDQANRMAIDLMNRHHIRLATCSEARRSRVLAKAGRIFRGWGGRIVPCVGPDGSGKTHFISAVLALVDEHSINATSMRFKNLYRKNRIYAWINKRFRNRHDLPKNTADERLAPILYWAALPAYGWAILKNMNRKAVFMDRFFLEFMVRGYRENGDREIRQIRGYRFLSRLIPGPRKMIVLTASNQLIMSRKAELSDEAIQDFYSRYIAFAVSRKVSCVLFLNTHHSGQELAECCLKEIGLLKAKR